MKLIKFVDGDAPQATQNAKVIKNELVVSNPKNEETLISWQLTPVSSGSSSSSNNSGMYLLIDEEKNIILPIETSHILLASKRSLPSEVLTHTQFADAVVSEAARSKIELRASANKGKADREKFGGDVAKAGERVKDIDKRKRRREEMTKLIESNSHNNSEAITSVSAGDATTTTTTSTTKKKSRKG